MNQTDIKIDLDTVRTILETALLEVERLDGVESVPDDNSIVNKREYAAAIGRDLLYLADAFQAASVLVKNEYWLLKGKALVSVP